eukprot:g642.t1
MLGIPRNRNAKAEATKQVEIDVEPSKVVFIQKYMQKRRRTLCFAVCTFIFVRIGAFSLVNWFFKKHPNAVFSEQELLHSTADHGWVDTHLPWDPISRNKTMFELSRTTVQTRRDGLTSLLKASIKAMEAANITVWLTSGSLLSYARYQNQHESDGIFSDKSCSALIPWEMDEDLAADWDEFNKKIRLGDATKKGHARNLIQKALPPEAVFSMVKNDGSNPIAARFGNKSSTLNPYIDLFLYKRSQGENGKYKWSGEGGGSAWRFHLGKPPVVLNEYLMPLRRSTYCGYRVNVPQNPLAYSTSEYGPCLGVKADWGFFMYNSISNVSLIAHLATSFSFVGVILTTSGRACNPFQITSIAITVVCEFVFFRLSKRLRGGFAVATLVTVSVSDVISSMVMIIVLLPKIKLGKIQREHSYPNYSLWLMMVNGCIAVIWGLSCDLSQMFCQLECHVWERRPFLGIFDWITTCPSYEGNYGICRASDGIFHFMIHVLILVALIVVIFGGLRKFCTHS